MAIMVLFICMVFVMVVFIRVILVMIITMIRNTVQILVVAKRQPKKAPVAGLRDTYSLRGGICIRVGQMH